MRMEPQGHQQFGPTVLATLFLPGAWLPMAAAQFEHFHPHEYMVLDFLLPMLWLGGGSIFGGACGLMITVQSQLGARWRSLWLSHVESPRHFRSSIFFLSTPSSCPTIALH